MALVLLLFLLNILGEFGLADLVNRTVDDSVFSPGDIREPIFPTYFPLAQWQNGADCKTCIFQPNSSMAFEGTWKNSTYVVGGDPRIVSITFTGSAVYAFFITAPIISGVDSSLMETHLNITLDGELGGSFDSTPNSNNYGYNQLVYAREDLPYALHTLTITNQDNVHSFLAFDYMIFTYEDLFVTSSTVQSLAASASLSTGTSTKVVTLASSTKLSSPSFATLSQTEIVAATAITAFPTATPVHQQPPIGAIVGGVVGGAFVILIIISLRVVYLRFYCNIYRSTDNENEIEGQAFPAGPRIPRTFVTTGTEIDPSLIPQDQNRYFGTTKKRRRPFRISIRNPTTSGRGQAELNIQMEEQQQQMVLPQLQSSSSSNYIPPIAEEIDDLRLNVELLQAEVERLRLAIQL